MNRTQGSHSDIAQNDRAGSPYKSTVRTLFIIACIAALTVIQGFMAAEFFTAEQMYIIRPILASGAIFIVFFYILWFHVRTNIFGEIGFVYLVLASAYTILPAFTVITTSSIFDGVNLLTLNQNYLELGAHFWRHVLFIFGVSVGYVVVRVTSSPIITMHRATIHNYGYIIGIIIAIILTCIYTVVSLSSPVSTYHEHYTRFEQLSWPMLKLVQFSFIFKSGCYFVLMALMFSQYNKYRILILSIVPIFCIYEIFYSFGSRIETLTILLAFAGFYHYKVKPLTFKKGLIYLIALAFLFSAVELVRTARMNEESVESVVAVEGIKSASEFNAVFSTGFHLYTERAERNIPPRDWQMFFYEFIALIPFLDHTEYHPQYWYARNYFPNAVVPPQTMGVISDSAIWGGELDLFLRSLINGAIYAYLTGWFLRRREKWWALTIYIYCYATCIMTLKYSILYQLPLLIKIVLPVLLVTGVLFRIQKAFTPFRSFPVPIESAADLPSTPKC